LIICFPNHITSILCLFYLLSYVIFGFHHHFLYLLGDDIFSKQFNNLLDNSFSWIKFLITELKFSITSVNQSSVFMKLFCHLDRIIPSISLWN
jgi:hypothetical protein